MITPKITSPPTDTPVSLDEIKVQCRIDGDTEDDLLTLYANAATAYVQKRCGYSVLTQTLEWTLDQWPCSDHIELPRATPLVSVTSVTYRDSTGTVNTLAPSAYVVDTDSVPGRVVLAYGEQWPSFTAYPANAIRVTYVAGSAAAPDELKIPILMLVGGLYENRESVVVADQASVAQIAVQYGVEAYIALSQSTYVF